METSKEEKALIAVGNDFYFDVQAFEHSQRVATMFAKSKMVPQQFRDDIGACTIALNFAYRTGVDPFMAMQNMYVVHGRPGIEAKLAIALVNASGRFEPIKFRFENNNSVCVAYAKEKSTGEILEGEPVTLEMAKAEGWMSKPGSKWKTMPGMMLRYRSAMFFARLYCPEVLLGLYTREELHEMVETEPGIFELPAETITGKLLSESEMSSDAKSPPIKWMCEYCEFEAVSERGLKKHITQQHAEKTPSELSEPSEGDTSSPPEIDGSELPPEATGPEEMPPHMTEPPAEDEPWFVTFKNTFARERSSLAYALGSVRKSDAAVNEILEKILPDGVTFDDIAAEPDGKNIAEQIIYEMREAAKQ